MALLVEEVAWYSQAARTTPARDRKLSDQSRGHVHDFTF